MADLEAIRAIGRSAQPLRGHIDELNLGQLLRERHGLGVLLVGFTTHADEVAAASEWGGVVARKAVRPSLPDSVERLLHDTGAGDLFLPLRAGPAREPLQQQRLERAIGVGTCPRRSAPATISTRGCPGSSTPCCTSTGPAH